MLEEDLEPPVYPGLKDDDMGYIINTINKLGADYGCRGNWNRCHGQESCAHLLEMREADSVYIYDAMRRQPRLWQRSST